MDAVRRCGWSVDESGTGLDDAVALATVFTRTRTATTEICLQLMRMQFMVVREAARTSVGMVLPLLRAAANTSRGSHRDMRHHHVAATPPQDPTHGVYTGWVAAPRPARCAATMRDTVGWLPSGKSAPGTTAEAGPPSHGPERFPVATLTITFRWRGRGIG
jgi:hypothetical protein